METADIGTQTKRSALKAHSNKSVKMKAEEVIETENIKSCEFEVFGIVQVYIAPSSKTEHPRLVHEF
ncbi:uncharacterized protein LOC117790736 isoform X2 [Drosophila innubila]|uniref:uncharacterized protein LOC117790736 isoform X2 n=1 Tax=Drosophila innubila TaxID=198719 RepID=UPI00148C5B2A|nr:uncharacterized protein LOC117790736 isoform X2 [Drosophila innubila]